MNRKIWKNADTTTLEMVGCCFGRASVFSGRSPHKTTANEDVGLLIEVSDQKGILGVFDGVGGANSGDRASLQVAETLCESLKDATEKTHLRPLILDAIEKANDQILEWGIGAASTLAIAELDHGIIRSYHVGDSMVLLFSNRGRIKFTTVSHAPTAMAVESGMLEESEAIHHEDRNLINNCLGCKEMRIEIGPPKKMRLRDTLVVASDGLADNFFYAEIAEILRVGDLEKQSNMLAERLVKRMEFAVPGRPHNPDDHTFLAFRRLT